MIGSAAARDASGAAEAEKVGRGVKGCGGAVKNGAAAERTFQAWCLKKRHPVLKSRMAFHGMPACYVFSREIPLPFGYCCSARAARTSSCAAYTVTAYRSSVV